MKNLSWFNKLMFILNIVIAILTLIAYLLPFLAPKTAPLLSVFTLFIPLFFVLNALFILFWAFQLRTRMIFSCLVLLLGISHINKFYKFSATEQIEEANDFTVMSYNVRLFNVFRWLQRDDVPETILSLINEQNPDILCFQEFSGSAGIDFKMYQHKFIVNDGIEIKTPCAIYSKFPLINQGIIAIPNATSGIIFADIKKGKDIIRVYNIHLESLKITDDVVEIDKQNINKLNQSKPSKMLSKMSVAFLKQQIQADLIREHTKKCKYPIIICGDFNNSAFSYVYRKIKANLQDSFVAAGHGFGSSYKFKHYPVRIDYILVDEKMKVKKFESFSEFENSDHYPIIARLLLEN